MTKIFCIFISGMLYHGVKTRKPGFVLAYVIMQLIGLVVAVIALFVLVVVAAAFSFGVVEVSVILLISK